MYIFDVGSIGIMRGISSTVFPAVGRLASWVRRGFSLFAPAVSSDDFRLIMLVFVVTTTVLWLIAYGAASVIRTENAPWPDYTDAKFRAVWVRWDSYYHIEIARFGYRERDDRPVTTPWFPLYGFMIRYLTHRWRQHYSMGQCIALASFFLMLCVLFDVVAQRWGKDVARLAVFYGSIFPGSVYLRAVYPDSLFVLLVLLSYRAFTGERYGRCGLYGALAAATRLPGIMLVPAFGSALIWEIVHKRKSFQPAMLWVGLIAAGLGAVMAVQWRGVGDPLAFLHAARYGVPRSFACPGVGQFTDLWHMVASWDFRTGENVDPRLLLNDLAAIAAMAGAVYSFRRYGFGAGCFVLCLLLPSLMAAGTSAVAGTNGLIRDATAVFVYLVLLAEIGHKRPWFHTLWIYVSGLLLTFYTACFVCWH